MLEKLRDGLESKDAARRAKAEQELTEVTDPRAVPMIWAIFVRGSERLQIAAVQMLGQIDGPSASNGLAALAVFSPSARCAARAIETLKRRDPRDVVGRLIGLIHKPYKYQVRHVNGPGSPGELFVEGERFNIERFYQNLRRRSSTLMSGRFTRRMFRSIRLMPGNLILAVIPSFTTNPTATIKSEPPFFLFVSFSNIAAECRFRGQATSADPRNAPAILGQPSDPRTLRTARILVLST